MLVSGSEAVCLLVRPVLITLVHYLITEKRKLDELLRLEEVTIKVYYVFIGHGYLQHGEFGWKGFHSLRYYSQFIPSSYNLNSVVAFAYGTSFPVAERPSTG